MVGVAAHITAAADDGPRYDPLLSPQERANERNGIWMCQLHGKSIDDTPTFATVKELQRWKKQHEKWVSSRVNAGNHVLKRGITNIRLSSIGPFSSTDRISLGRYNILLGNEGTGKSTFCQAIAALAGGHDYERLLERFGLMAESAGVPAIEIGVNTKDTHIELKIIRHDSGLKKSNKSPIWRMHKEINNNISLDWPRDLFGNIYFDLQLYRTHYKDPKDIFRKAILYIASALHTNDDTIWDSFREDLYISSPLGFRFRRTGKRRVEILVPDGRKFYLPHGNLSHSEQAFAVLDIALSFIKSSPTKPNWTIMLDTGFFGGLDRGNKIRLINALRSESFGDIQIFVCVNDQGDADLLREHSSDSWIRASSFGELTVHSFL